MINSKEKVIRAVETCFDNWLDRYENIVPEKSLDHVKQLKMDALELLKEKEAVEARKKNDGKPQPWTSWWYVCGDCGQEIEYHDRFCRWCGRAVKWDA